MKKIFLFGLFILAPQFMLLAQENFMIKSSVKINDLPEDIALRYEMDYTTWVKNDKWKIEASGKTESFMVYFDSNVLRYYADYNGNKLMASLPKKDLNEKAAGAKKEKKPRIEYTSEKKVIAGYECTKVIINQPEPVNESASLSLAAPQKKESNTIAWITDKIMPADASVRRIAYRNLGLEDLKGTALEAEGVIEAGGSKGSFVLTTQKVDKPKIEAETIESANADYKEVSYSELADQLGLR